MKYQNVELYQKLEIDIPVTMDRFMNNEEMYLKFLNKFAENEQFAELRQQIADQKWEDALMTSHNLKSFTGNLSLVTLHQLLSSQVAKFREGDYDGAGAVMTDIDAEREKILGILKESGVS